MECRHYSNVYRSDMFMPHRFWPQTGLWPTSCEVVLAGGQETGTSNACLPPAMGTLVLEDLVKDPFEPHPPHSSHPIQRYCLH